MPKYTTSNLTFLWPLLLSFLRSIAHDTEDDYISYQDSYPEQSYTNLNINLLFKQWHLGTLMFENNRIHWIMKVEHENMS
jgi:hypothetical protein